MSSFTKLFIAALAAGSVHALPQMNRPSSTGSSPMPTSAPPAQDFTDLIQQLELAPTSNAKFQKLFTKNGKGDEMLPKDELAKQIVFDFNGAPLTGTPGKEGGTVKKAEVNTFPVLTGLGISVTVATLAPCGMNTPHTHPRATELLTLVDGQINFGMILENGFVKTGSPEISGTLKAKQATVFPVGSIHYQFNDNCQPATFVAALNSEDPGTSQIAQNFINLNQTVVQITTGFPQALDGQNFDQFKKGIPANLAKDMELCLKRCNSN